MMVSNGDRIYLHASHTIGMLGEGAAQGAALIILVS